MKEELEIAKKEIANEIDKAKTEVIKWGNSYWNTSSGWFYTCFQMSKISRAS